jgi:tetratricopeptide (TPR) repeat protein
MAAMPMRPRAHVVEEESLQAFRSVLPAEWTVARIQADYGIDARVDIFEQGAATGLAFSAQIKGTDEPDLRRALKAKVDVTALTYMSAQADPVLLVRYHAPTGRLYGRWLHHKDIILKRKEQKTYVITWSHSDLLGQSGANLLVDEVRRFRRFSAGRLENISVHVELSTALAPQAPALAMMLTEASSRAGDFLLFNRPAPHDASVTVTEGMLRVDMGITSTRIEFPAAGASVQDIAANIIVASAVCLAKVGRPDVSASLIYAIQAAPALANEEVARLVASAFASAGRWRGASDLARHHLTATDQAPFFRFALVLEILLHASEIPPDDARHVADNMVDVAIDVERRGKSKAGAEYYTAANFLFHTVHDYPRALAAYEDAARVRPDYLQQGYYLGELAAAQFETGAYELSAATYELAIAIDSTPGFLACRADSLAHSGRYRDALTEFELYEVAAGADAASRWLLEARALRTVLDHIEADQHTPRPTDDQGVRATSIAAEALSPMAWHENAKVSAQAENPTGALEALVVVCAFPSLEVSEPWGAALATAYVLGQTELFDLLAETAWGRRGDLFAAEIALEHEQLGPNSIPGFLETLREKVDALRAADHPGVDLRLVHQDGFRDVVRIYPDARS